MNLIAASQRQSAFVKLAGAVLARLSKVLAARPGPRYVNIGEFSPHLQRDMGFLDGSGVTGAQSGCDARDLAARDRTR